MKKTFINWGNLFFFFLILNNTIGLRKAIPITPQFPPLQENININRTINAIADENALAIANSAQLSNLSYINLSCNNIPNKGDRALLSLLERAGTNININRINHKLFLQEVSINATTQDKHTALMLASYHGHLNIAQELAD